MRSRDKHQPAPERPRWLRRLLGPLLGLMLTVFPSLFLVQHAHAIDSDRHAPIEIQADNATLSEITQTAVYKGHVELKQGTLHITCHQLTVFKTAAGVERVEATGNPATYTQVMDANKPPVDASAQKITYLPSDDRIRLEGVAKITQGGNLFEGQLIEYDLDKQILMASGNDTPTQTGDAANSNGSQRVKMTLQPKTTDQ